ncbi:MAG: NAD(+) synthase [Prevotellaceae bacterium]|jgi:NAD+ synthase (glutamine-hydrolysing)|nr:NAD(+) synthase [Prevotellaceae bacterium]
MTNFGFIRCAVAAPQLRVADCNFNAEQIIELVERADNAHVALLCFPELCITAYTCGDLFYQKKLRDAASNALQFILKKTAHTNVIFIVGMPVCLKNAMYNVAVVCKAGKVVGVTPKTHLPNNQEFYEKRWFASGKNITGSCVLGDNNCVLVGTDLIFETADFSFGIELCEDLWTPSPPSAQLAMHGAEIICNLSASNELTGKHAYRKALVEQQSARCNAGYIYASAGAGESTTDLVFSGAGFIVENGTTLAETERFALDNQLIISEIDVEKLRTERIKNSNFNSSVSENDYRKISLKDLYLEEKKEDLSRKAILTSDFDLTKLYRTINPHPFVPPKDRQEASCEEIFSIQTLGLCKRWQHTRCQRLIIGVSGGLDSALALLVAVRAADKLGYDRKNVTGITMPGFGTTERTYRNALNLMTALEISQMEIPIEAATLQHFKDIGQDPDNHDITYENAQARERTQILMDIANQRNGLVVGTGDLSELALGWATYNGDHMSMYAVNNGVPKTLVRYLIEWAAQTMNKKTVEILKDIYQTPISPELLPADNQGQMVQFTEDVVGPYELHDFFLYYFVRFGFTPEKILFLAKNAFKNAYTDELIEKWLKTFLRRFFAQQFKRSCMPDGPKVGSINLSPRGDWRMPSDAVAFSL